VATNSTSSLPNFSGISTSKLQSTVDRARSVNVHVLKALLAALAIGAASIQPVRGATVTVITHGFAGNVDEWIIPMALKIPDYHRFPGTNFSFYEIYFVENAQGNWFPAQRRIGGVAATNAESGEIIVALDWSQLAGGIFTGAPYSTTEIAPSVASALLSANFLLELGGRALAELPLHLVGHSRGGSLMCEVTRLLGAQGVWVDHLTTLDPHPLNNDGFDETPFLFTVDASARAYVNVLFADNYYQENSSLFGTDPSGEPILGAYNRYVGNLSGGYNQTHSDVHLWYHGTIDLATPTTDTQANITAAERQLWWTTYETGGINAGLHWSLIGRGDRLSTDEPAGAGTGRIRDGNNRIWDLGAGLGSNRYALASDNGSWPNIIRFNLLGTNTVTAVETNVMKLYYQCGANASATANLQVFLDNDLNPLNGNAVEIHQATLPGSGTNSVNTGTVAWSANPTTTPGTYALYGKITAAGHSRYLYAPELLTIKPSMDAPSLTSVGRVTGQIQFTVQGSTGQRIIVQASPDLVNWNPIATNTLTANTWNFTDTQSSSLSHRFYRAVLVP